MSKRLFNPIFVAIPETLTKLSLFYIGAIQCSRHCVSWFAEGISQTEENVGGYWKVVVDKEEGQGLGSYPFHIKI